MVEPVENIVPTGDTWDIGRKVAKRLEAAGYQAYFVGGSLRDFLLGRPVHDIDIATNARPENVLSIFPKAIPTGLQHGTVTVIVDGHAFEITTFRIEAGYHAHRWPEVAFIDDLRGDLSRRDFTINAMALSPDGRWFDPFNGQADLRRRLIRAVGVPEQRFSEDALRMLRAVRFAAQLDFQIEPDTWAAITSHASLLSAISMERIQQELQRIMLSDRPDIGMRLLQDSTLTKYIAPLATLADGPSERFHGLRHVKDAASRWAMLFLTPPPKREDVAKSAQLAATKLRQLKCSRQHIASVQAKIQLYGALDNGIDIKLMLLDYPDEEIQAAIRLYAAIHRWTCEQLQKRLDDADKAANELRIRSPRQMAVNGHDLQKALGFPPGPWIRRTLRQLYEEVAFGRLANEEQAILNRAAILVRSKEE